MKIPSRTRDIGFGLMLLGAAMLAAGCSDNDGGTGTKEDPQDEHGCDHLQYGPFVDLKPGSDAASATELRNMASSKIALEADKAGYVKFTAGRAGVWALFSDTAGLKLELQDDAAKVITAKESASSIDKCSQVKTKAKYDLQPNTYVVKLGPQSSAATVSLVLVSPLSGMHMGDGTMNDDAMMMGDGPMNDDAPMKGDGM